MKKRGLVETDYAKSQRLRKEIKKEHKLGINKKLLDPTMKRQPPGNRGGTIATSPLGEATPEQIALLNERVKLLPEDRRKGLNLRSGGVYKLSVLLNSKELALELIAVKPDVEKIKLLCDPLGEKKR